MRKLLFWILVTIWSFHAPCSAVLSQETGIRKGTRKGGSFMTGGVSKGERAEMEKTSKDYNLKIVLATASGAYLAGIPVGIYDHNGQRILEDVTEGPWLYVCLPDARYTVKAIHDGREKKETVQVGQGLELVMFHWDMK